MQIRSVFSVSATALSLVTLLAGNTVLAQSEGLADNPSIAQSTSQVSQQAAPQSFQTFDPEPPILEMCDPLTARKERRTVKAVARPPYLKEFKEPAFGTRTIRVTNSTTGEVNKPAGHSAAAWNNDESLILLYRYFNQARELRFLDGSTYKDLGLLKNPTGPGEQVYWSHTDSDSIFYVQDKGQNSGQLIKYNVRTAESREIVDFAPICNKQGLPAEGGFLAKPSIDDDLFIYRCGAKSGKSLLIRYRQSEQSTATQALGSQSAWPIDSIPMPTYSGRFLIHQGLILDENFKRQGSALDIADSSTSIALGIDNQHKDALYQASQKASPNGCNKDIWNGLGMLIRHNLPEGTCSTVLNQTDGYPLLSEPEISASAYLRPNWLAMSNIGAEDFRSFTSKTPAPLMFSEIFIVNTQYDKPQVCRLAHHRSFGEKASNAKYPAYLGNPNVTQSPSGTRVIFSTDWYDSGFVDSYVLELPSYTRHKLQGQWVDLGNKYMISEFEQAGRNFSVKRRMINPESPEEKPNDTITIGNGEIKNSSIELNYIIKYGIRRIPGKCSGLITEDTSEINVRCLDDFFGRSVFIMKRPDQ